MALVEVAGVCRDFRRTNLKISRFRANGHLWRDFRSRSASTRALDNVTFQVTNGEIYGILGPNGAGKTTLPRILATLLTPTSGIVKICGHVLDEMEEVRRLVGFLPEDQGFYWRLSGREYLEFFARLYNVSARSRIQEVCKTLGIEIWLDQSINSYSHGMRKLVALARTLLHDPTVLLLDEPTLGLDQVVTNRIHHAIKELASLHQKAIIITTHNMREAEILCNRLAIIKGGKAGRPQSHPSVYSALHRRPACFYISCALDSDCTMTGDKMPLSDLGQFWHNGVTLARHTMCAPRMESASVGHIDR